MIPVTAWLFSILGLAIAWIVMLGHAMSTTPSRLSVVSALGLSVLPVVVLWLVWSGIKSVPSQQQGKAVMVFIVPALIALFTLFGIVTSMEHRWLKKFQRDPSDFSHLTVATFEPVPGLEPTEFEVRRIVDATSPGGMEIKMAGPEESRFVARDVIITSADVVSTSVEGPYTLTGHAIGISFSPEGSGKMYEASKHDDEKEWAVILGGEIIAVAKVRWPIRDKVVIEANYDEATARAYAKGIVQAE